MPQMRIIGRGQYSTCRRGMFLRQIGRFCGRVGTRKALREVFSANASFIIPYVSVALLALLCALGGMKRVAWCFGAGVLDLWRRCDFWVGTCATGERLCPFPGAGSPLFPHLRQSMVTPAPPHGYTCASRWLHLHQGKGVAYRELAVYRKCALAEVLQGRFNLCIFARTRVK